MEEAENLNSDFDAKGKRPNAQPYSSSIRPAGPIPIVTYLRARCPEVSHGLGILEREEVKE